LEALVLRLPESGVVEFVEACEAADGWTDPQGATFCHRDDRDGDILRAYMLAAWRLGRWSRVRPHGESYRVTAKREGFTMQTARQVPAGSTDVWCVRTDSGTWTTRAPGVSGPMLTGNTLGKIYGIGTKKFAKQQGVTVEEAEKFMAFYDEKFPGVTDFVRAVEYTARHRLKEEGTAYVQVDGGRKHQLTYREAAEWEKFYTLVNYICQGTAAELLKEKIVALRDAGLAEYIRLPVHDEILFEVPVEKVYEVGSLALEVMEDRSLTKWAVPITCDLEIYDESWAQSVEGARSLSEYAPKE
jgi:hypothetical protein